MRRASLLLVLLLALLVALAAYPQDVRGLSEDPVEDPDPVGDQPRHPNVAKGIDPEKAVVGNLDSINLFNGNLTLTVPIGQRYPLSSRLSYQLLLTYNSTVWDFEAVTRNNVEYTAAYPDRRANAGFGWSLSLGRLYAPQAVTNETAAWIYEGADGSDHRFFERLHIDETIEPNVFYTRDGSYLRLRDVNGIKLVEFPDGTVQEFEPDGPAKWRLRAIRDQFSSRVDVTYPSNGDGTVDWLLTDSHGRQHRVEFIPLLSDGAWVPAVDKVVLAGPDNGVLTYDFTYAQETTVRPCADTDDPALGGTSAEATVQALSRVQQPDGTGFDFGYNIIPAAGTTCFGAEGAYNGGRGLHDKTGTVSSAYLPTRGWMTWTYGQYQFPGFGVAINETYIQYVYGVTQRTVTDPARNTVSSWSYTPQLDTDAVDVATDPPNVLINAVVDPAGNRTDHYFNVQRQKSYFHGTDYGLPYSPLQPDPDDATRFLSRREYSGSGTTNPIREHYVRYEDDEGTAYMADPKNRRLVSSKTSYDQNDQSLLTNTPVYAATTYSDFDGLGHYRTATTAGTFRAGNAVTTYTNYNPDRGQYLPGTGSTFTMPPSSAPWVLGTFSEVKKTEGSSVVRKQYCFNTSTGALERERVLAGTAPGAEDLLSVYVLDGAGNPVRHDQYGATVRLSTRAPISAPSTFRRCPPSGRSTRTLTACWRRRRRTSPAPARRARRPRCRSSRSTSPSTRIPACSSRKGTRPDARRLTPTMLRGASRVGRRPVRPRRSSAT